MVSLWQNNRKNLLQNHDRRQILKKTREKHRENFEKSLFLLQTFSLRDSFNLSSGGQTRVGFKKT